MPSANTLKGYCFPICRAYAAYELSGLKAAGGTKTLPGLPSPCEIRAGSHLEIDQRMKFNGLRLTGRFEPGDVILSIGDRENAIISADESIFDCVNGYIVVVSGYSGLTDGPVPPGDGVASCPVGDTPDPDVIPPTQEPAVLPDPPPTPGDFTFNIARADTSAGSDGPIISTPADFSLINQSSYDADQITETTLAPGQQYNIGADIVIVGVTGSGTIAFSSFVFSTTVTGVDIISIASILSIDSNVHGNLYFGSYTFNPTPDGVYPMTPAPSLSFPLEEGEVISFSSNAQGTVFDGGTATITAKCNFIGFQVS